MMRQINPTDRPWLPEDFGEGFTPLEFIAQIEAVAKAADFRRHLGAQGELMLKLLVYCYGRGMYSSREIERFLAGHERILLIWRMAPIDERVIRAFRRRHRDKIEQVLAGVLRAGFEGSEGCQSPNSRQTGFAQSDSSNSFWWEEEARRRMEGAILCDTAELDE